MTPAGPAVADPKEIARSTQAWHAAISLIDRHLANSGHVAGEGFTIADIPMALGIHRWRMTPLDHRPDTKAIEAYMNALSSRPGFANWCRPDCP